MSYDPDFAAADPKPVDGDAIESVRAHEEDERLEIRCFEIGGAVPDGDDQNQRREYDSAEQQHEALALLHFGVYIRDSAPLRII